MKYVCTWQSCRPHGGGRGGRGESNLLLFGWGGGDVDEEETTTPPSDDAISRQEPVEIDENHGNKEVIEMMFNAIWQMPWIKHRLKLLVPSL